MANETKETAKISSISVPNVKVDINGTTYEYFMTNDIKVIHTKLKELGCRPIVSTDYRFNPNLAQSVRDKMVELHCTFSLLIAKNLMLINYYSGAGSPYIIYLQELIQQTSAIAATSDVVQKLNFISSEEGEKLCSNWNPLPMAIINKSTDMVKALLDAGANPNIWSSYGYTPLMLAVSSGKKEIVELLLKHGADVNTKTPQGVSAIVFASFIATADIVQLLKDAGAHIEIPISVTIPDKKLSFNETLEFYISENISKLKLKPSIIWKRTQSYGNTYALSKQTFSKIRSNRAANFHPKKKNVFFLALGLRLTLAQTENLLASAGYVFDDTNPLDKLMKDHIERRSFYVPTIEQLFYKKTGTTLCTYDRD